MRERRQTPAEKDVPFERVSDRIGRVAVPLPFFSVPVNVYVHLAERPLLVDTGPKTDLARERVLAGLEAMGTRPEELAFVFVTHHHADHAGLLHEWIARSSATALVHEDDFEAAMDVSFAVERRLAGYREAARRWGLSEAQIDAIQENVRGFAKFSGITPRERGRPISGERVPLDVPGARLTALHTPGHTEGQALLWDEEGRVLYGGDHVLERVTPNPNVYVPPYRGRTTGLADFCASLRSLATLPEDTLVLPGHGAPFRGLHARIDGLLLHHGERAEQVVARLEGGPRTIAELAQELWKRLDPQDLALAAREVHGHLDMLEAAGRVRRSEDARGAWRFERVA